MNAVYLATRLSVACGLLAVSATLAGCTVPQGTLDDFIQGPGTSGVEPPRRATATSLNSSSVYRRTSPSVVTVITDINGDGEAEGLGTGFAVGADRIATNVHVIADLDFQREAERVWVQLRNGERFPMQIVGTDSHADVALLRFATSNGKHSPVRLRPLRFGTTEKLAVGEPVAAIGAPLGETNSMSVGQVSGIERTIAGLAGFNITGAIQTDAAITLGNSGGPLLNARGEVIGINDQIMSIGGGGEGLGFAVPAETIARSVREISKYGKVRYAYLGVRSSTVYPQLARFLGLPNRPGVLVQSIRDGSPAKRAGLRGSNGEDSFGGSTVATGGDFIVSVNGRPLRPNEKLTPVLDKYRPGETIHLGIVRDGENITVDVRLTQRPLIW